MTVPLAAIVSRLDAELRISEIPDYPGALNGLQLAGPAEIAKVSCAVDFSLVACRAAVEAGAQLLVVHHGMFWGGAQPLTGHRYEQLALLTGNGVAVYAAHLPLDVHPELGNNVLFARDLGLEPSGRFLRFQTIDVGLTGESDMETGEIVARARAVARAHGGDVITTPLSKGRRTRKWGVCTGGGASSQSIAEAVSHGIDTLVVGEGPHHTAVEAIDSGICIVYAGHYATETFGVRAVGEMIALEFGVAYDFIHAPTGL